jgi:serine/threonine-protein kinase RsbW
MVLRQTSLPVYSSSEIAEEYQDSIARFRSTASRFFHEFLTCFNLAATTSRSAKASTSPTKGLGDFDLTESTTSRISYTLDSSLDSVNKLEQTAEQVAQRAGLDEDEVFRVSMAVREAAVNAVLHGNAYDPLKKMTAHFEVGNGDLVIRIADQGKGLDPSTLPDPLAPENILSGSGRGIFLIRSFMDEVHFKQLHPGTELTLIKHLGSAQTGA